MALPPNEFIAGNIDPQSGWIPLEKIYTKERIGRGAIRIQKEEIPFIHPKDLCILRIKHQMTQDGITGAAHEGLIPLCPHAVLEIDLLFPEIVNPNGGGYSSRYLTAYGEYPDFLEPSVKHKDALKQINDILTGHNYPQVWVGNLPYTKPDGNAFGKNDIYEVIANHTGIDLYKIRLIKLVPPTSFNRCHGGAGTLYIQDEETAALLKSFDRKIPISSKIRDEIIEHLLILRDPL